MNASELREYIENVIENASREYRNVDDWYETEYDAAGLSRPNTLMERVLNSIMAGVEEYAEDRYNEGFSDGEFAMANPL